MFDLIAHGDMGMLELLLAYKEVDFCEKRTVEKLRDEFPDFVECYNDYFPDITITLLRFAYDIGNYDAYHMLYDAYNKTISQIAALEDQLKVLDPGLWKYFKDVSIELSNIIKSMERN